MKWLPREIGNALFILFGILSAGMGLHGFLQSSGFIDGGVTGVSMLLAQTLRIPLPGRTLMVPLPILLLVINLPFVAMGYRHVGRSFAIRSALSIIGLSICLATVHFPDVTSDKLLTAVFGGFFLGAGMGLAMRGGAVLDGTDIAALLISKRSHVFHVGDVILGLNIVIFLSAAFFLGVEKSLYSILTYVSASKTLDFLLHGIEEYTAINIVSEKSDADSRRDQLPPRARGHRLQGPRRPQRPRARNPLLRRHPARNRQDLRHRERDRCHRIRHRPPARRSLRRRAQANSPSLASREPIR